MSTGLKLETVSTKYKFHPRTILDIGAQTGEFARECKELWPNTKINMIEATRECEPYLQGLSQREDYEYQIAVLSDVSGKQVNFYKTKHAKTNTGNSLYRENSQYYNPNNLIIEERITETLDEICKDGQFDLVKIDTQGSEVDIMKGGVEIISKAVLVILEVSYANFNIGAPLVQSVDDYMTGIGFAKDIKIGEVKGHGTGQYASLNTKDGIIQADYVYVNKEFIK